MYIVQHVQLYDIAHTNHYSNQFLKKHVNKKEDS
jgi:hypothetical protein